jgi:photosystem II stability/assembly factor-like uncharacterized protein
MGVGPLAINAVAVDPMTPQTVYAAPAAGTSILKSADDGATWAAASDDLDDDLGLACLAIDPNFPATIYAGGEGVLKSGDGGQSWGPAALLPSPVTSLAVDPSNSAIVYAGTSPDPNNSRSGQGGLFVSTDFGQTFHPTSVTADAIGAVAADPSTPGTVYAAGVRALYKSADSGATWTTLTDGSLSDFHALAFDPANPGALYACLGNGQVYNSPDGGATLTATDGGFQTAGVTACVFSQNSVMHIGAVRGSDAFVMKLDGAGAVRYATYLGGKLNDTAAAIAVDGAGNAYITGTTASSDFPVAKATQAKLAGAANAFLVEFDPSGTLLFSTFLGGSASDDAVAMAVAANGTVYIAGTTSSPDFPLVNGSGSSAGGPQQFVVAFH